MSFIRDFDTPRLPYLTNLVINILDKFYRLAYYDICACRLIITAIIHTAINN